MQLTDIGLHDVVDSVWNQMLGYEIVPTDGPIDFGTQPYLVGCVSITGDYDITLLVEVPEALARNLDEQRDVVIAREIGRAHV